MYRGEIDAENFYAFINDHVEFQEWLKAPLLKSKHKVDVGIDQSSTRTGICIQSPDLLYVTELPRGFMTVPQYKKALITQLHKILNGLELNHFIFEMHGRHITPLHSMINEITDELKNYTKNFLVNDITVKGILPTVWRKGFLSKEKYSGEFRREQVKEACKREAVERNPLLQQFANFSGKDLDGFEAYGIINGYLKLNYAEDGTRIVNTSMQFKNGRHYDYRIYKCREVDLDEKIKEIQNGYNIPVLYSNSELLLDNSLNRVVGGYDKAIILYKEHSEICRFIIELQSKHNLGDIYLVSVEKR